MQDFIDEHPVAAIVLLLTLIGSFSIGMTVLSAYNEAQAFERLTGKKVSTWDAIFLELRVQEPTK